jgi:hypothetical protein
MYTVKIKADDGSVVTFRRTILEVARLVGEIASKPELTLLSVVLDGQS